MRCLVTGGAGFIGSHLVDALVSRGDEVTVIDNLSSGRIEYIREHIASGKVKFIQGDLLNREDAAKAVDGMEAVFHLAANPDIRHGTANPDVDLRQGVVATHNLLEAMRQGNVKKIVFASSSVVYGEAKKIPTPEDYGPLMPISLYGAAKLGAEGFITAYCGSYGLQAWIYRFANVVGPRGTHGVIVDFINKLKKNSGELEILGNGKQTKSYLSVEDTVGGMLHGFNHANEQVNIFNLGTNDWINVTRIAEIVVEELGLRDVKFRYTGGDRGWSGDVPRMLLSTEKIGSLGWKPLHRSEDAVRRAVKAVAGELWGGG
ncbi:MAG: NAD-dependent epimerase/dehydratase family protein [Thermoplasmata archaeon]|nr:NAD-dependent epimerase/dehydratase family protein [Thermoplasmata archaeon]